MHVYLHKRCPTWEYLSAGIQSGFSYWLYKELLAKGHLQNPSPTACPQWRGVRAAYEWPGSPCGNGPLSQDRACLFCSQLKEPFCRFFLAIGKVPAHTHTQWPVCSKAEGHFRQSSEKDPSIWAEQRMVNSQAKVPLQPTETQSKPGNAGSSGPASWTLGFSGPQACCGSSVNGERQLHQGPSWSLGKSLCFVIFGPGNSPAPCPDLGPTTLMCVCVALASCWYPLLARLSSAEPSPLATSSSSCSHVASHIPREGREADGAPAQPLPGPPQMLSRIPGADSSFLN